LSRRSETHVPDACGRRFQLSFICSNAYKVLRLLGQVGVCPVASALARKLDSLRERGALADVDVAKALGAEPGAVSAWQEGRLFPQAETEKTLVELEYIVDLLADFYQPHEARRWLFAAQKLLGGAVPAELIRQGRIDEVLRLAGQLREAVYF